MPIVLSVLYAAVLLWQLNRMLDSDEWVHHSSTILTHSSELERHIQFQESALRGYLIDPNPIFLVQFHDESLYTDSLFQVLHILVLDNRSQVRLLDSAMQLYWGWQSSAQHSLEAAVGYNGVSASESSWNDSTLLARTGTSSALRAVFHSFKQHELSLYAVRIHRFQRGTALLIGIIAAASIIIGMMVGFYARRQTRRFINRFTEAIDETTESRDLLETALLSIEDAIIVTGVDDRITLMNSRAENLTGWQRNQATGRSVEEVFRAVQESNGARIENPVRVVLRERDSFHPQGLKLFSRLGVDYPIELMAAAVHGAHNEIVAVVIVFRDISELRENQRLAELREQEFRALIENTPDIIIRYLRDLTILYANPAVQQVLGVNRQALIGRHFKDIGLPAEVYTPWERAVRDVFETGRATTTEMEYRTVRGIRSYHVRLVPELDMPREGKEPLLHSVISIARDVTDLKQVEQRLRESERRFRGIVENSPDAFFLLRAVREPSSQGTLAIVDFMVEYVNQRAGDLLTQPLDDIMGRKLSEVMPGDRPKEFIEKYAHILESGVAAHEDYEVQTPYVKKARWLHSQYIPLGDMLAVTTADVTSRMQTVLALEHSEERYRNLVEHASEAIFSTDRDGRFTYANPYIRTLGGYGTEDVTHYHFTDLVPETDRNRVKRHFYRQFLSRRAYSQIEAPFRSRSGEEIWLAIKSTLQFHGEEIQGFDCVATDITERRRIEKELKDVRTQEASRVEQQTKELREQLQKVETELAVERDHQSRTQNVEKQP